MVKKYLKKVLFIAALVGVVLLGTGVKASASKSNVNPEEASITKVTIKQYKKNVKHVKTISFKKMQMIASNGTGLIYVGRPTCPYCRNFSKTVAKLSKKDQKKILYYNVDSEKNMTVKKQKFLVLKLKIQTTPALIQIKNGVVVQSIGNSKISLKDLKRLISQTYNE